LKIEAAGKSALQLKRNYFAFLLPKIRFFAEKASCLTGFLKNYEFTRPDSDAQTAHEKRDD